MKKKINIVLGILLSSVFIYLAFRGINFTELAASFKSANYLYFFPVVVIVIFTHYLRCYRWGKIMDSMVTYDQKTIFIMGSIGFMAIGMLPARLGEFVRPYLVKQKSGVKMSASMATIIVERVFDLLSLMLVMFAVMLKIELPAIIFKSGLTMLSIAFTLFFILIFMAIKKDFSLKHIDRCLAILPEKLQKPLSHLAHSFIEGLQILPDIKKTLYVAFLSILIWVTVGITPYILFHAFGFELSIFNGLAISVIIALGVMLPAAPGFVGTYHYACVLGLTAFGITKAQAASFAITLHFLQMIPVVFLGLVFLPFQKISLSGMIEKEEEEMKKEDIEV